MAGMDRTGGETTRRCWLAHCSLGLVLAGLGAAMPFAAAAAAPVKKVLVVGDSLSAEYGLTRGDGWVALLDRQLAREGRAIAVVNASISGDTTAGGAARLPALLRTHRPDLVIIELGGNDALRGLPLDGTRANLDQMARLSKSAGAKVLLLGMQVPPNYGRDYGGRFAAVFTDVARSEGIALVPFVLHGIADVADAESMFQADRIHPLAKAHPTIVANVLPVLLPLLK